MDGLSSEFKKMYREIGLGVSDICKQCREENACLSSPFSIWQKGKNFDKTEYRLMFIGKTARGNPEGYPWGYIDNAYIDTTIAAQDMWNQFAVKGAAYWKYTRQISEQIFGEDEGWESIAFTNIMKCNKSTTVDMTNDSLKTNCIDRMKVVKVEISVVSPLCIVFITGVRFDNHIKGIFDKIEDNSQSNVVIGKKKMPWWEFKGTIGNKNMRVLRIGHPERMKREPYINFVVDWVLAMK